MTTENSPTPKVKLILCDRNEEVRQAWQFHYNNKEKYPEVEIRDENILETDAEAILIGGNGFGYLDRGLELSVCETFGWDVQDTLRERIRTEFRGELLVGQALSVQLSSGQRLIYSCQYRTPRSLDGTLNAYLATRGGLFLLDDPDFEGAKPSSVVISGIGTGSAGLHPYISSRQVRYAYTLFRGSRGFGDKNMSQLARREAKLIALPKSALEGEGVSAESD